MPAKKAPARKKAAVKPPPPPPPEPELDDDVLEIDGIKFRHLAQFPAFFVSQQTATGVNNAGVLHLKLGVPREGRAEMMELLDTEGEQLLIVAFKYEHDTYELA